MKFNNKEKIEKITSSYEQYINFSMVNFIKKFNLVTLTKEARGSIIKDIDGNDYIDCIAGYGILNIGHNHPKMVNALKSELDIANLMHRPFMNEHVANLAEKLNELIPEEHYCSFFCNSGSEAIDSAIKLARLYTAKTEIIAFEGAFHGFTYGALSLSGIKSFANLFQPLLPNIIHLPFNDIEAVKNAIMPNTAAILLEPMQHEAGIRLPHENFLQQLRKLCDENGLLLILDEVKTGFGKTGKFFALEHYNILPDILVLGKSMSGGIIPIGAIMGKKKLWNKFSLSFPMSASSFAGNSLACLCGLTTIKIIEEEELLARCQITGKYLLENLKTLLCKYPERIKSINGFGLLMGIEFNNPKIALAFVKELINRRVLAMQAFGNTSVVMIEPPLCLTDDEAQKIISAVIYALDHCQ